MSWKSGRIRLSLRNVKIVKGVTRSKERSMSTWKETAGVGWAWPIKRLELAAISRLTTHHPLLVSVNFNNISPFCTPSCTMTRTILRRLSIIRGTILPRAAALAKYRSSCSRLRGCRKWVERGITLRRRDSTIIVAALFQIVLARHRGRTNLFRTTWKKFIWSNKPPASMRILIFTDSIGQTELK